MSNYYAAKELINQSISCVPIIKRSKAFDKWALDARGYKLADLRDTLPTVADLKYWWGNSDRNIAALTNEHLLVLDFDKIGLYYRFKSDHPTLAHSRTVKSGNGYHVYFKVEESIPKDIKSNVNGMEVKHNGAAILVPGSIHPNGKQYQYVNCGLLNKLSMLELTSVDVLVSAGLLYLGGQAPQTPLPSEKRKLPEVALQQYENIYDQCDEVAGTNLIQFLSNLGHTFTRSGDSYIMTQCPFHNDDTPSLWIDTIKMRCNCFNEACKANMPMDLYDVIMRLYGVGFKRAKKIANG